MKIDSHQHFWKYTPAEFGWIDQKMQLLQRDFLPLHLESELQLNGFHGSIAVQARQSLEETKWLLDLASRYHFIKGIVGWLDLCSADVKQQVSVLAENPLFVGVRHILQDEPDDNFMLQDKFLNGLQILQRFNLVYDLLIFPRHLPQAIKLVAQIPGTRFVLDHLAKPFIKKKLLSPWQEGIADLAKFPNVWCKVSGMVTEADWQNWKFEDFVPYLDTVFGAFGPNRILIGSDWPVCTLAGSYQQVVSIVIQYLKKYTAVQQEAVLGGNAMKVYRLQIKP